MIKYKFFTCTALLLGITAYSDVAFAQLYVKDYSVEEENTPAVDNIDSLSGVLKPIATNSEFLQTGESTIHTTYITENNAFEKLGITPMVLIDSTRQFKRLKKAWSND